MTRRGEVRQQQRRHPNFRSSTPYIIRTSCHVWPPVHLGPPAAALEADEGSAMGIGDRCDGIAVIDDACAARPELEAETVDCEDPSEADRDPERRGCRRCHWPHRSVLCSYFWLTAWRVCAACARLTPRQYTSDTYKLAERRAWSGDPGELDEPDLLLAPLILRAKPR